MTHALRKHVSVIVPPLYRSHIVCLGETKETHAGVVQGMYWDGVGLYCSIPDQVMRMSNEL